MTNRNQARTKNPAHSVSDAVGTQWAMPPKCSGCRRQMKWPHMTQLPRLDSATAADLRILDTPLAQLGLPVDGAMLIARAEGEPAVRFVLNSAVWNEPTAGKSLTQSGYQPSRDAASSRGA